MIILSNKKECCGCSACVAICPKKCITLQRDDEGFLYANADANLCIDCHLCEQVCPVINRREPNPPQHTFAAKHLDAEIRLKSSSGGVFSLLAQRTLQNGGVVYGASYDKDWQLRHIAITTLDLLPQLRGSKYMQSDMGDCYQRVKNDLQADREVLFSGTPCQVAGLKNFLRKEYEKLFTVDIACHGVPSPKVWGEYLRSINPQQKEITDVNMRDKSTGWQRYSITIKCKDGNTLVKERASHNAYMRGFLYGLYTRPSCYDCPAKAGRSGSDITLCDFWGVRHVTPAIFDKKGVSLLLVNSQRGMDAIDALEMERVEASYAEALKYNRCIEHSAAEPPLRENFWQLFHTTGASAIEKVLPKKQNKLLQKVIAFIQRFTQRPNNRQ